MRQNRIARLLQILLSGLACLILRAAFSADAPVNGVQYIPYDPPNQNHIKVELSYSQLDPIPNSGGKIHWQGVKIRQFPLTNSTPAKVVAGTNNLPEPLLVAETPECISDNHLDEIASAAPLQVHAEAGKLFLEGVGFLLIQTNSSLVVSNQVHSVLRLRPETNGIQAAATEISSHRGEFEMKNGASNGLALYITDVHVVDPEMKLNCEWLRAELPKADTGQAKRPNHIIAETNVVIDFVGTNNEKIHAIGQRGIYDYLSSKETNTEVLQLSGEPRLTLTNGWMTADLFVMDRITSKLRGHKNCHLHFSQPGQTNAQEITITSEEFEYDLNTRLANFWTAVHADDGRTKLSCEKLSAVLPKTEAGKTNQLEHVLAETNVVIDFVNPTNGSKMHAIGQKATYDYHVNGTTTNQILELTGNPSVELTNAWMAANVIRVDRAQGRIWGEGGQHSVLRKAPGEPASMDTEIFSDSFTYSETARQAVYQKGVRVYDPELNLTKAALLTVQLANGNRGQTNRIEKVVAEGGVALDFAGKAFAPGDITNLTAFAGRLKKPGVGDNVAQFVGEQLSVPTSKLLKNYSSGTNTLLQIALAEELNRLTQSGSLYNSNRFENVYLSLETTDLMKQHPVGLDLVQLNRLLLLDAFRGELARGRNSDKTHATGERVIYTNIGKTGNTNALVELYGHPSLTNPSLRVEAADAIFYNSVTGKWEGKGQTDIYPTMTHLSSKPEPDKKGKKRP